MKAAVYHGPGDIRIEQVKDAVLSAPTDAVVRVTHACICGTDLWPYRGVGQWMPGFRTGHEFIGVVEDVGSEVRSVRRGDRVISPFAFSDGSCDLCHEGLQTSCAHGGLFGGANDGGQGEAVRVPWADGTLVALPRDVDLGDQRLARALASLTDVMGTGHHAALSAGVERGMTVAVVGDGAVGLCGVLAAKRLGAERVVVFGRHEPRLAIAKTFGATDFVRERGREGLAKFREIAPLGADAVLECVGTEQSLDTALRLARPGRAVGFVGVPHTATFDFGPMFRRNVSLRGGIAPVRAYLPELLEDVLEGRLDPSPVFDLAIDLDDVPRGYAEMDARTAIKAFVRVS